MVELLMAYDIKISGHPTRFNGEYSGGKTAQAAAREARKMLENFASQGYKVGVHPAYGESMITASIVRYSKDGNRILFHQAIKPRASSESRDSSHRPARAGRDRAVSSAAQKESARAHEMSTAASRGFSSHIEAARAHSRAADAHQRAASRTRSESAIQRHTNLMNEHVTQAAKHERGSHVAHAGNAAKRDRSKSRRTPTGRVHHHRKAGAPTFKKQKWISSKIALLRHEGYPPKQAEAIAYRMAGVSSLKKKRARRHDRRAALGRT